MNNNITQFQKVPLLSHGDHQKPVDVQFFYRLQDHFLQILYKIQASPEVLGDLEWPRVVRDPERKDELWKTTVFELFLSPKDSSQYIEFNFSPSLNWNAYEFETERQGMKPFEKIRINPAMSFELGGEQISLEGKIDLKALGLPLDLELSPTVILDWGSEKSYWAAKHCKEQPDFHCRESFAVKLLGTEA